MTLDQAKSNQRVEICQIDGGWCLRQRLNQIGLYVGAHVIIKQSSAFGGPLVIVYNNSQIAIGRGMAAHIQIKIDETKETQHFSNDH
ncbi:ferrous iron transport protein A [candidate division KSB1 bacterium]|nr:ferrous iron transport protein A [candidate division KSB1 bacterium]RQW04941.1 MAG: ferrous iron transport protein A [candidate division KSB1 bacterium]